MSYFWGFLGWLWSKRGFFALTFFAALVFFVWFFPFSDLSDLVTSKVAAATNNQIYVQFETMDLAFLPVPAVSARNVSVETPALPALEAKWMKVSPSWLNIILNAWTIKKASSGDPEAAAKLSSRLGGNVSAEGLLGADVELKLRPSGANEQGVERSKVSLFVEKLNLGEFQKWSDLPLKIKGQGNLDTTIQFTPGFSEQPDGDIELKISKFEVAAGSLPSDMGPIPIPYLSLANVVLHGHLAGGKFVIEDGSFGQKGKDPIYGRIKGQIAMVLQANGPSVRPVMGAYDFNVDLNVQKSSEKELMLFTMLFDNTKTTTPAGSHYVFKASQNILGVPPTITKIQAF